MTGTKLPAPPSPDVMEVWREARRAWRSGPAIVRDEETNSVRIGDREAAANVIAEAKARWLAEKDAEIARLREALSTLVEAPLSGWTIAQAMARDVLKERRP